MAYLDAYLEYEQSKLGGRFVDLSLALIAIDPDWNNIRNTPEFQALIQKYEKITQDKP